nr:DUF6233 domain-containing protein [Streptomyces sp. NBC_00830]
MCRPIGDSVNRAVRSASPTSPPGRPGISRGALTATLPAVDERLRHLPHPLNNAIPDRSCRNGTLRHNGNGPCFIEVRVGGCYAAGKRQRSISHEQALAALDEGIRACIHCRPDTELGVLG